MKKIIKLAVVFTLTFTLGAFAQERGRGGKERLNPEKRAEMQTKWMAERLELSEDQKGKLLALTTERNRKSAELNKEAATKQRDIHKAYSEELTALLTPEQQEKLKAARKEMSESKGDKRKGYRGKQPGKPAPR